MKKLRNNVKLFNSIEDMILEKKNIGFLRCNKLGTFSNFL